ncbi:11657_t:CDS:2, partial [Funneliformis geosporum]
DYETKTDELTRKKGELEAEITNLETKYKKKAKLLDEEQCENNKLTQRITSLEQQIEKEKSTPLPQS